jgi:hypothetical protein
MARFVVSLIAVAFVVTACDEDAPEPPRNSPNAETVASSGDGEECADATPSGMNHSSTATKFITVYFSCAASAGGKNESVYPFEREPAQTPDGPVGMAEEGVRAYFNGPTKTEARQGYISAVQTPFPDALNYLTLHRETATLDLAPEFVKQVPSMPSAAGQSLLRQLEATVFHVPEIDRLRLQVDGDCSRFWSLLQMTCRVLERSPREHLDARPDEVPSAPWADPPNSPPN